MIKPRRALCTLVLLAYLFAAVCAVNDNEWHEFEPRKDKYVMRDALAPRPASYQFRNCEFVTPGSVDYSSGKPVPIKQLEGSTADSVRGALFLASSAVAVVAVTADTLKAVFSLTSAVLSGIPLVGSALGAVMGLAAVIVGMNAPNPIEQAMDILREEFTQQVNDVRDYVEHFVGNSNTNNFQQSLLTFQQSVVDCYAQKRIIGAFMFCMRNLEARFAQTASYLPNQHASVRYVSIFPHSILFASLYPAIATDYLDSLARHEERVCSQSPNGDACQEAYRERKVQVGRIIRNLDRIISVISGKVLPLALADVLPRPFTNNATVLRSFTYDQHVRMVAQYAVNGSYGTSNVWTMESMDLHKQHSQPLAKDAPYPPAGNIPGYADEREDRSTFMWVKSRLVGWERSTVKYKFSADANCEVKGNHYTGYQSAQGVTCHTYSAWLYPERCKYYKESTISVVEAAVRVMQSRLEDYYALGAAWAKKNIIDKGDTALVSLKQFRKILSDTDVFSVRKTQDYFNFDNGFPRGAKKSNSTMLTIFQGNIVASISSGGFLEISLDENGCADVLGRSISLSYAAPKGGKLSVISRPGVVNLGSCQTTKSTVKIPSQTITLPPHEHLTTTSFPINSSMVYSLRFQGESDQVHLNTIDIVAPYSNKSNAVNSRA